MCTQRGVCVREREIMCARVSPHGLWTNNETQYLLCDKVCDRSLYVLSVSLHHKLVLNYCSYFSAAGGTWRLRMQGLAWLAQRSES